MRVLICAGRYYADSRLCRRVLEAFQRLHEVRVVIHGGSQFLGAHIEDWARETGAHIVRYPPNWQLHGKHAERLRNSFDGINIKLMKCGGITEAMQMIKKARELDMQIQKEQ